MGQLTDARIAAWQEAAGIEPATGERAAILCKLSDACFEAIKIIELERSGIRDGDGYWQGSDVIGHLTGDLTELCAQLNCTYPFDSGVTPTPPETQENDARVRAAAAG
jgi:hypothetical protein